MNVDLQQLKDKLKLVELIPNSDKLHEVSYDDVLVREELLMEILCRQYEDDVRANKNIEIFRL